MSKVKNSIIVCSCIGICLLSFIVFWIANKQIETDPQYVQKKSLKESLLQMNFDLNCEVTGVKAPDTFFYDEKRNEILFSSLVTDHPVLIFRYADINCNTCFETQLEVLHKKFPGELEKVIILCSYVVDREFIVFKKMNQIKLPIYRISHDVFPWTVEDSNNPYYFVLHPDMSISNIYVPDKSYPKLNDQYLESIKRLLSD